ncbi:MAG TPA: tyrosine-protein phosphatase [Methylomirabilota bacterium]|nr:tyrosine-protein phosphatase [Methylomirabilota bacterium]
MTPGHGVTAIFRALELPADVAGRVYLASMPGRYERLEAALHEMDRHGIERVVCLTPDTEIEAKAPEYLDAVRGGGLRRPCERLDVTDYRAPADENAFRVLVDHIARRLRQGERILVHCAGGIGRTGTLAICLLVALGWTVQQSREAARRAGSRPESDEQNAFIGGFAGSALGGITLASLDGRHG